MIDIRRAQVTERAIERICDGRTYCLVKIGFAQRQGASPSHPYRGNVAHACASSDVQDKSALAVEAAS